ncbi:MAG: rhodanese-like domain-containing protein, partial [Pseudomonadales bacterium]
TLSCTSLHALLEEKTLHLIDVRSNAEHLAFNIGGSNIPLEQIAARLPELKAGKTLVLYCQSGQRSAQACSMLAAQDITAKSLDGGLQAWLEYCALV